MRSEAVVEPLGEVLVALPVVPVVLMVPALPEVPGLVVDVEPLVPEGMPESLAVPVVVPLPVVDEVPMPVEPPVEVPVDVPVVEPVPEVEPVALLEPVPLPAEPDCACAMPRAASIEATAAAVARREESCFMDGSPVRGAGLLG
jgi:hypothetical protein